MIARSIAAPQIPEGVRKDVRKKIVLGSLEEESYSNEISSITDFIARNFIVRILVEISCSIEISSL